MEELIARTRESSRSSEPLSQDIEPKARTVGSPDSILDAEPGAESDALPQQHEARIEVETPSGQQDDESRRKLVRQLFNDFWAGADDKPATFAERLEIAEGYINERLAERNVTWRLDAATRMRLGLPNSSASVRSKLQA